jgi:hypothetical protein
MQREEGDIDDPESLLMGCVSGDPFRRHLNHGAKSAALLKICHIQAHTSAGGAGGEVRIIKVDPLL